jgi:antitoxin (DNA-binding transcriptional repressor) of toxin-antitoxin stability system
MKTIKASEFAASCLQWMDEVTDTGNVLVITKDGRPVAQLAPIMVPAAALADAHRDSPASGQEEANQHSDLAAAQQKVMGHLWKNEVDEVWNDVEHL